MKQLTLLPQNSWSLDEETKRIGRHGLATAREILAAHNAVATMAPIISLDESRNAPVEHAIAA